MDFYARVKRLVGETEYKSLQEFIIETGINHDSYYMLKRDGNLPRVDDACKIASALGVSVEYLVTGKKPDIAEVLQKWDAVGQFLKKL
jgi:transcriptional regulator with XRE-family HTH domain